MAAMVEVTEQDLGDEEHAARLLRHLARQLPEPQQSVRRLIAARARRHAQRAARIRAALRSAVPHGSEMARSSP